MVGKTPAVAALAVAFTMSLGLAPCMARNDAAAAPATSDGAAAPSAAEFTAWRDRFRARALQAGIPHDVFEKALGAVRPDPKVHEKNDDQPEFNRPVWEYLDGALSQTRIRNGREMLRRHGSLLAKAERTYGVPQRIIVAIWGMETSYGALLGKHNIFEALATLSYRGGRTDYGEEQLLAALRLLADGHKPLEDMRGSWAGAVGHTQFIPTTYLKYAVDGDNDGRRDLWDSLSDVFHSTAHYLKESGYDSDLKWGREAVLPDNFDYALTGYDVSKPLSEWRELGVRMTNGALVPKLDIEASVLVPAGHQGPAFLVYASFHAILAYNQSTSYALAIGLLSDEIQGGPSLKKSWPRHLKPLHINERVEIQRRLAALGYTPGKADGVLGRETRKAIRAFQKTQGDVADGYATAELLTKLRAASPAETASAAPAPTAADGAGNAPEAEEVAMLAITGGEAAQETTPSGQDAGPAKQHGAPATADTAGDPAPAVQSASATEAEPAENADTPLPRAKPGATDIPAGEDAGATPPGSEPALALASETPRPRAKPSSETASASASRDGSAPQEPGTKFSGVTAALSAPGLVILRNGVAAPLPRSKQAALNPAPVSGGAIPLKGKENAALTPPGFIHVEAGAEEEEAPAAGDEDGAPDESDMSNRDRPDPDPGG